MVAEQRPFDVLQRSIGQNVLVRLKGNTIIHGILKSFDPHLNLFLENAKLVKKSEDADVEEDIGQVVLRGDNVLMVSPP